MGSLPNLHELERTDRKLEKEREFALFEKRAKEEIEFTREQFNQLQQTALNSYFTTDINLGLENPSPRHYHRHSLASRRVLRTRSSGGSYHVWNDSTIEHLPAYSPVSNRSHRVNGTPYQIQLAVANGRRRESINSSIGATSIRRLLTMNSRNCRHQIPSHIRSKICRSFTLLTIAHGLICGALLPFVGLQGSNSIWHHQEQWVIAGPNIGSLLLSISFLISAFSCLKARQLIRVFGCTNLIVINCFAICLFFVGHICESIFTLIPSYIILGMTMSPAWIAKLAAVVYCANRLSCSQNNCAGTLDDHKTFCNRDQKIRRLARWFQAAQDMGIVIGASIASTILVCTSTDWECLNLVPTMATSLKPTTSEKSSYNTTEALPTAAALTSNKNLFFYFDLMYNHNEHGERICGAALCPVWGPSTELGSNQSTINSYFASEKGRVGGVTVIFIYLLFSISGILLTYLAGKIDCTFRNERTKGIREILIFASPMAFFVGTEQGYMLGDFTRAFVSCSIGISTVAGALVGMGIMQSIVSCTLSMLLRYTKRIVVILAGFFFHACLLLVLSRWKPSSDDSALFYVIAASWGACNGMWETLLMALVTLNHTSHFLQVVQPLFGMRFLGLGLTFLVHGFLCENVKILILVIILVVSVPPYAILEIRLEAQRKAHLISL